MSATLRHILAQRHTVFAPGVWDGLSAKVAEAAGFEALYASGGAIARSAGFPDMGLLTFTEMYDRLAQICGAVAVPVIVDADSGYGNALNVRRTVTALSALGVAAIQLEDQVTPKKCGHYGSKAVISSSEMVGKVRAAIDARSSEDVLIIARTDARAVWGLDDAIQRARAYHNAGADIVFIEAPETVDEVTRIAAELSPVPLLINMFEGGRTPYVAPDQLRQLGFQIVIIPSDLQRAAVHAMQRVAAVIRRDGSSHSVRDELVTFDEREEIVGQGEWLRWEARYGDGAGKEAAADESV